MFPRYARSHFKDAPNSTVFCDKEHRAAIFEAENAKPLRKSQIEGRKALDFEGVVDNLEHLRWGSRLRFRQHRHDNVIVKVGFLVCDMAPDS